MIISGIYKIISKINNKYYYGSSEDIDNRWKEHLENLAQNNHHNIHLQRSYNKYTKENFYIVIIENCDGYSRDQLFETEQKYLDLYVGNSNCYNIAKQARGGDNISNHPNRNEIVEKIVKSIKLRYENLSDNERQQMSENMKGKNNHMFGNTHSDETCKKISDKLQIFYSEHNSYRKGKTFEELFDKETSDKLHIILSDCASKRIGNKNPFFGKKHTEQTKEKMCQNKLRKYNGSQNIPVIIDGVRYESVGQASKMLNIKAITIRWRVLSKNKKFQTYQYA